LFDGTIILAVNRPTPAIVTQGAVRRLPRIALLLLCLAYVLPGFVGRDPWKNADIAGFGMMFELAKGSTSWLAPTQMGQPPEFDSLLPYWLGAWAMKLAPPWIEPDFAARVPFGLLLTLTLVATWYAVYALARAPRAQPVPFAFGGEANPTDYARAMADGGLLALVACLGLAQLSHETTPALAQVAFTALSFYGLAALTYRPIGAGLCFAAGLVGLALSGAPTMALLFGAGGLLTRLADGDTRTAGQSPWLAAAIAGAVLILTAAVAAWLDLWHWRLSDGGIARDWRSLGRLMLWFTWPAWPLALWTLWRWRRQLASGHVALPLWFTLVAVVTTWVTPSSDRSLLLALPALAALAAFALPTLRRSVAALIDWFTLLFFSGSAVVIWVVWISLQTGVPAKPAANVSKLAPGFEPSFSLFAFAAALAGTVAWAWLVRWRTGRHRVAIWKSLVLPAAGAVLCWLLLMTLWLPVLDYARGFTTIVRGITRHMNEDQAGCVEVFGLNRAQVAAFRYHGNMDLRAAAREPTCPWLLVAAPLQPSMPLALDVRNWQQVAVASVRRPADVNDNVVLYRKVPQR